MISSSESTLSVHFPHLNVVPGVVMIMGIITEI